MPSPYARLVYDHNRVALLVAAADAIIAAADSFEPCNDYDGAIARAIHAARVALAHMPADALASARRDAPRAVTVLIDR